MKRLLALFACGSTLVGCAPHADWVRANTDKQPPYGVVSVGVNVAYLIDPRTESCALAYSDTGLVLVSCAKLKKNVPEAAHFITWDTSAER